MFDLTPGLRDRRTTRLLVVGNLRVTTSSRASGSPSP